MITHSDQALFYAHSLEVRPESDWQPLHAHLRNVAEMARRFACHFGAGQWGYAAGLWHDMGKYSHDFQKYIRSTRDSHIECKPGRVDHSSAGALYAIDRFGKLGRILAYLIAGHHAGLPDWQNDSSPRSSLSTRLATAKRLVELGVCALSEDIGACPMPTEKAKSGTDLSRSLWLRMLFSCLVDADFLDTEDFMDPERASLRGGYPTIPELAPYLERYMATKSEYAADTPVNRIRAEVLAA